MTARAVQEFVTQFQPMPTEIDFRELILEMSRRGVSQYQIADATGLKHSIIWSYANNRSRRRTLSISAALFNYLIVEIADDDFIARYVDYSVRDEH